MNEVATVEQQLLSLAKRVRAEHKATEIAVTRSLEHALAAGDLLIEAKQLIGHGQWLPWLAKHCDLPDRTAQLYMRCARERILIEQAAIKSATVADLTLRNATSLLAKSPPKPKTTVRSEAQARASKQSAAAHDQDSGLGDDAQTVWRRGLMFRAQTAIADAAYEDWSNFAIDQEAIDTVLDAAKAWTDLGKYLQRMNCRAHVISTPTAEPTPVDDGIPEFLRRVPS